MSGMYTEADHRRLLETGTKHVEEYRSDWRRDAARVLHSPAFRRLVGKTQLFPGAESDFFRNRLTHSLEVGQIGKSIAVRLNATEKFLSPVEMKIEPDIVEMAGWCHDLGHPPFGHNGEYALDDLMRGSGGFEGNAQSFRILCRLEKKEKLPRSNAYGVTAGTDVRFGLNLTARTLASVLKYDKEISNRRKSTDGLEKGFYSEEAERIQIVKDSVTGQQQFGGAFKTIECAIMDIADDIAYSTYDLEDAFKAGFLTPFEMISARPAVVEAVCEKVGSKLGATLRPEEVQEILYSMFTALFADPPSQGSTATPQYHFAVAAHAYNSARELVEDGYLRSALTSQLVDEFINAVQFTPNEALPALSSVHLTPDVLVKVEVLKQFTYQSLILSPDLRIQAYRGGEVVRRIFTSLSSDGGPYLLPPDVRALYESIKSGQQLRVVSDFVASMTDRYALEYYGRLFSESAATIFKPL